MRGSYKYDKDTGAKIEASLDKDGRAAPWYLIRESTDRYLDATWERMTARSRCLTERAIRYTGL